jgi:soluble lytic murein transglycosylase-like protein
MVNPAKEGGMIPDISFELKGPDAVRQRYESLRSALRPQENTPSEFSTTLQKAQDTNSFNLSGEIGKSAIESDATPLNPFSPGLTTNPLGKSPRSHVESVISQVSREQSIDYKLLRSVVQAESDFNPSEISSKGAQGLMQLMPETAKEMGVTNALNPYQNLTGGAKYLKQMLVKYNGNIDLALAAYNAGPGAVDKAKGIPNFPETQNYVKKIRGFMGGSN